MDRVTMDMYPPQVRTEGTSMALATETSSLAAITAATMKQVRPASQSTRKPKGHDHEPESPDVKRRPIHHT